MAAQNQLFTGIQQLHSLTVSGNQSIEALGSARPATSWVFIAALRLDYDGKPYTPYRSHERSRR
jgi:hypothetical protein